MEYICFNCGFGDDELEDDLNPEEFFREVKNEIYCADCEYVPRIREGLTVDGATVGTITDNMIVAPTIASTNNTVTMTPQNTWTATTDLSPQFLVALGGIKYL